MLDQSFEDQPLECPEQHRSEGCCVITGHLICKTQELMHKECCLGGFRVDWDVEHGVESVLGSEDPEEFSLQRHVKIIILPVEGYHRYLMIKVKGRRLMYADGEILEG
jgi:hypothetical protein